MDPRYRLKRRLGEGGMAEVFVGVAQGAEGFERPVAIKRILPHLAQNEQVAQMFVSEVRLATHLQHQNVVQTIDVGRGPDGVFIVMELVNGWDLGIVKDHAEKQGIAFPPTLVAYLATQVMAGLSHAYRKTVEGKPLMLAHRDVSPSNVLISREGEVKVADFGIAKLGGAGSGTEAGVFKGKVLYAAPEVLRGVPATSASDQFGLGVVLFELLTGRHPFGEATDLIRYVVTIESAAPILPPGVPPLLAQVVLKLLAVKPSERFDSPEAVSRALSTFLAQSGVAAGAPEWVEFLGRLGLPSTALDLPDQPEVQTRSFSLHASPVPLYPTEPAGESAWEPTGAVMDTSGRLQDTPSASATVDSPLPPALRAPGPAFSPRPTPALELAEPRVFTQEAAAGAPLEEVRPAYEYLTSRPVTSRPKWPYALLALVALGAGGVFYGPRLLRAASSSRWGGQIPAKMRPAALILQIDSEPSGATVRVNGTELGQTPLYQENLYPPGDLPVQITLRGYRPWEGTFRGGEPVRLTATLKRK